MKLSDKVSKYGRKLIVNEGIKLMRFSKEVNTYCPLGKNITTKKVEVILEYGEYIPDLGDIEDYFKELEGDSLINEDLLLSVKRFFNYIEPKNVTVRVFSSAHFELEVQ